MRADKTLSELNDLLESTYNERLSQTARMAVNTIKRLQAEIERLGIENSRLQTNVEIADDGWKEEMERRSKITKQFNELETEHKHLRNSINSLLEHWEYPGEEEDEEALLKSASSFLNGVLKGYF
jgi:FtsZ-binding cell division protein ZapB